MYVNKAMAHMRERYTRTNGNPRASVQDHAAAITLESTSSTIIDDASYVMLANDSHLAGLLPPE